MPTSELSVPNALSTTLQNVQDEAETFSALRIATNQVEIKPNADVPGFSLIVDAPAQTGTAPSVLLASLSSESAIRFTVPGGFAYHMGLGGNAGDGKFFFFSGQADIGIVLTIEQNGNVRIEKNLSIGGELSADGSKTKLLNVPPATTVLKHLMIEPATGQLFHQ